MAETGSETDMGNGHDYTGHLGSIGAQLAILPAIGERLAAIETNQKRDKEEREEMKATNKAILAQLQQLPCKDQAGDVKALNGKVGIYAKMTWINSGLATGLLSKLLYDWIVT